MKRGFTLIELVIVLLLLSLISFLVIRLPSTTKIYTFSQIRQLIYPTGEFQLFSDGRAVVVTPQGKREIRFRREKFELFTPFLKKKNFPKPYLFRYKMVRGVGECVIVKTPTKVYFFKPLQIETYSSLQQLREHYTRLGKEIEEEK